MSDDVRNSAFDRAIEPYVEYLPEHLRKVAVQASREIVRDMCEASLGEVNSFADLGKYVDALTYGGLRDIKDRNDRGDVQDALDDWLRGTYPNTVIDMREVVRILVEDHGVVAFADYAGGNVYRIHAGEPFVADDGDERYPAIAGPGHWHGQGAIGYAKGFFVGPDDEGVTPVVPVGELNALSAEEVAALVLRQVRGEQVNPATELLSNATTEHGLAQLADDAPATDPACTSPCARTPGGTPNSIATENGVDHDAS